MTAASQYDLSGPEEARIAKQRNFLVTRINAVWRNPEDGLDTEVRLVAVKGGVELGLRGLEKGDTPVNLANWALDEAHEFMLAGGIDHATTFDLRIGPACIKFPVYPDNVTGGSMTSELLVQQALQHNESLSALFFEATRDILRIQGETVKSLSNALTERDSTIAKLVADQLAIARTNAEILDTKRERDIEMRALERKEQRYDMGAQKVLGMLDGVTNLGGQFLMKKAEKSLQEDGNVIDKFADMLDDDEKKLFAMLFSRVSARAQGQSTAPLLPKTGEASAEPSGQSGQSGDGQAPTETAPPPGAPNGATHL